MADKPFCRTYVTGNIPENAGRYVTVSTLPAWTGVPDVEGKFDRRGELIEPGREGFPFRGVSLLSGMKRFTDPNTDKPVDLSYRFEFTGGAGSFTAAAPKICGGMIDLADMTITEDPVEPDIQPPGTGVSEGTLAEGVPASPWTANTWNATFEHTPNSYDNYVVVAAAATFDPTLPTSIVYTPTVRYRHDGKWINLEPIADTSTAGKPQTDNTRGQFGMYGAFITPGKPKLKNLAEVTLTAPAVGPANTGRATAISFTRVAAKPNASYNPGSTTGNNNALTLQPISASVGDRLLVASLSSTKSNMVINHKGNNAGVAPAKVLWKDGERPFHIVTETAYGSSAKDSFSVALTGATSYYLGSLVFRIPAVFV